MVISPLLGHCRYASENVNKLLVGNKSDLASKRAVTFEQGKVGYSIGFGICTLILSNRLFFAFLGIR